MQVAYDSKSPAILAIDISSPKDNDFQDPNRHRQDNLDHMNDQLVQRDFVVVELDHLAEVVSLKEWASFRLERWSVSRIFALISKILLRSTSQ